MKLNITGGAAESIQSINVAAAVAVAAAAGGGGLASPAATLKYEKTVCVAQNSSFSFSFNFFWLQPSLFPHVHARPELVQRQGQANKTLKKKNKKNVFWWAFFCETMEHLLNLFLHSFVHLFSSAVVQLHQEPLLLLQHL